MRGEIATIGTMSVADAFDANVLINAVTGTALFQGSIDAIARSTDRLGSMILLPEVLTKPLRVGGDRELRDLTSILATFSLKSVDQEIADAAVTLGAKYRLKAPDAIHLATAVVWGAERFYTHNTKDFGPQITEIDVVVPGAD